MAKLGAVLPVPIVHNAAPSSLRAILLAQPVEFAGDCLRIRIELIRSDCGEFVQLIEAGWPRDDFEPFAAGFINQHRASGITARDQGQLFRSPVETWRKPGHLRKEVHCRNDFCRIACRVERDLWAAAGSDLEVRSVMIDARRDGQAVAAPLHLKGLPGRTAVRNAPLGKSDLGRAQEGFELFQVHTFSFGTLRMHSRPALQWGMKVKVPKPSSPDPRVSEIQQWTKSFGSSVANAYVVNADALRELGAERGVIEKILWRVAREDAALPLTSETMMEILAPKKLMREVRKQLKLDDKTQKVHAEAFERSRLQLIASKVPKKNPERDRVVREVEGWFKAVLPEMRDTKAILRATELRLEAGNDIHPVLPPLQATTQQVEQLNKREPGRVYIDKDGKELLLLKPKEQAVLDEKGLRIENGAVAMPGPGMS